MSLYWDLWKVPWLIQSPFLMLIRMKRWRLGLMLRLKRPTRLAGLCLMPKWLNGLNPGGKLTNYRAQRLSAFD